LAGWPGVAVALRSHGPSCGISLRRDHWPMTAASSYARGSQVDEIQYATMMSPSAP
jgi:hypothetical protein